MQQVLISSEDAKMADDSLPSNANLNSSDKQSTKQSGVLIFGIGTEIILQQEQIKLDRLSLAIKNGDLSVIHRKFNSNAGEINIGVQSELYSGVLIVPLDPHKKIELQLSKANFDEGLKMLSIERLDQIRQLSGSTEKFLHLLRNNNSKNIGLNIGELNKKLLELLLELIPKVSENYINWRSSLPTFEESVKSALSPTL
jgi:hypothetical protein